MFSLNETNEFATICICLFSLKQKESAEWNKSSQNRENSADASCSKEPAQPNSTSSSLESPNAQDEMKSQEQLVALSQEILKSLEHVTVKVERPQLVRKSKKSASNLRKSMKRNVTLANRKTLKKIIIKPKARKAALVQKIRNSNLSEPKKLLLIKSLRSSLNNEQHEHQVSRTKFKSKKTRNKLLMDSDQKNHAKTGYEAEESVKNVEGNCEPRKREVNVVLANIVQTQTNTTQEVDEEDLPLSQLIVMKRIEMTPADLKCEAEDDEEKVQVKGESKEQAPTKVSRQSTTTDELIQKLNSTPTTSILKKRLLSRVGGEMSNSQSMFSISMSSQIIEVTFILVESMNDTTRSKSLVLLIFFRLLYPSNTVN